MSDKVAKLGRPKESTRKRTMQNAYIDQDAVARRAKEFKPFNMKMDPELHERLRVSAFHQRVTMTDIVQGLIRDYLDERKE